MGEGHLEKARIALDLDDAEKEGEALFFFQAVIVLAVLTE